MGIYEQKIFARKCEVKKIEDVSEFIEKNHLQGNIQAKYKYGLFYKDELVSTMTFGKPRFNTKYDWEILRFCSKTNTNIIGGFSKILSFFRKQNKGSMITYSDKRYSNGNVYLKNGFVQLKDSSPNYWYIKNKNIVGSRIKFQKHKLKNILEIYNPALTEWENMQMNGYDRIWDCGNSVFIPSSPRRHPALGGDELAQLTFVKNIIL